MQKLGLIVLEIQHEMQKCRELQFLIQAKTIGFARHNAYLKHTGMEWPRAARNRVRKEADFSTCVCTFQWTRTQTEPF